MTYKTGSIGDFMRWTKQVVTDPVVAKDTPKRRFDSDEPAAKHLGTLASPMRIIIRAARKIAPLPEFVRV